MLDRVGARIQMSRNDHGVEFTGRKNARYEDDYNVTGTVERRIAESKDGREGGTTVKCRERGGPTDRKGQG